MHFDPADPDFVRDPYPSYAALRAAGPPSPSVGSLLSGDQHWAIARYDDVMRVLRSPADFSSSVMLLPGQGDGANASLLGQDPPVHDRQRKIVSRGFTPRRIGDLEERIEGLVDGLFSKFEGRGEVELIRELAGPLPVMVIAELLGLDAGRHDDFKRWSDALVVGSSGGAVTPGEVARCLGEMRAHLLEVIEQRRQAPSDDLISTLIAAEEEQGVLNAEQLFNLVQLLVAAGSETTTNLIGNAVWVLATQPTVAEAVVADVGLVPRLIEETLRWESPVQLVMRRAAREVELDGARIPAGAFVFVLIASANRDERRFSAADRFELARDATGHLSFGFGAHFCLGASLARLEARLVLEALIHRLGRVELASDRVETHGSFLVRGPRALPLRF